MSVQQVTTTSTLPKDAAIAALAARLRGPVLRRGEESYAAVRPVYNAMIDKYPDLIARCVDTADVISAVTWAREHRPTVAIGVAATMARALAPATGGW